MLLIVVVMAIVFKLNMVVVMVIVLVAMMIVAKSISRMQLKLFVSKAVFRDNNYTWTHY